VRWGVGYTGSARERTGPQPTFKAYCKRCKIGERMAKPPTPYLGVQVTKPEPDEHSVHGFEAVLIAIHASAAGTFASLASTVRISRMNRYLSASA